MSWSSSGPYLALGYLALLLLICGIGSAVKENRKRRTRVLLQRLNSPFFRNIYDPHFRAGKLN